MKHRSTSLSLVLATVALTAQATVYRAGLKGGFINSYDANNYTTASIADIGVFASVEAGGVKSASNGSKTYPPIWADNRTWRYHGQMYFDGGTYYFAESVDDAVWMTVDGTQILKDATWNNVGVSSAVAPAAGWHNVEIRLGNGTGGAGVPYDSGDNARLDANGRLCGFGVASYATAPGSKPTAMSDFTFAENTAGNVWMRCVEDGSYITLNSIEQTATGYRFNITSSAPSPATVVVYAGDAAGAADSATGWDCVSSAVSFAANGTESVDVDGIFANPPYFVINLSGTGTTLEEGNGVEFWEWSDVSQCIMEPTVAAVLSAVSGTSGTFDVTLGYDKTIVGTTPPAITLKAYYGAADAGATATGWDGDVDFGANNASGTQSRVLDNLQQGQAYYARFAAKTADSDWVWSDAIPFSLAGVYLDAVPERLYENDPAEKSFKVCRPAAGATEAVTVGLAYSGATAKVSALPASVTLAAGVAEATVPFTLIDNDAPDGNATLTIQIVASADYLTGEPASAVITIVDEETAALVCEWTGEGDGMNWSNPTNWSTETVPTQIDTALFGEDVAANLTVTMCADAIARLVRVDTPYEVKLGAARSPSIQPFDITIESGSGTFRLASDVNLTSDVTYDVGEGVDMIVNFYSGSANMTKKGMGTLKFYHSGDNNRTAGTTYVLAGRIEFGANKKTLGSRLEVGGAGEDAVAYATHGSDWNWNPMSGDYVGTFVIGDKGVLDLSKNTYSRNFQTMASCRVLTGGLLKLGKTQFLTTGRDSVHFHLEGDVEGASPAKLNMAASGRLVVPETRLTPLVLDCNIGLKGDYYNGAAYEGGTVWGNRYPRFFVAEIPGVPVGLTLNGHIDGQGNGDGFDKRDAGVMRITSSNSYGGKSSNEGMTRVHGGTLLIDNAKTGSATGKSRVEVGVVGELAGTLGGTGRVGGLSGAGNATLNLTGNANGYATLHPGTIDDSTGAHVAGTLTAGSVDQACPTAFNNRSRLQISVCAGGAVDSLEVCGKVTITGEDNVLAVDVDGIGLNKARGGTYTILSATDGIEGDFASVSTPTTGWKIDKVLSTRTVVDENDVESQVEYVSALTLTVPDSATVLFVR